MIASRVDVPSFLRYGMYSRIAGTGSASASSGSQIRAASLVPSASGMNVFAIVRTRRGNSVRIRMALLGVVASLAGCGHGRGGGGLDPHARPVVAGHGVAGLDRLERRRLLA